VSDQGRYLLRTRVRRRSVVLEFTMTPENIAAMTAAVGEPAPGWCGTENDEGPSAGKAEGPSL
jgi:hypothetical protein